MKTKLKQLHDEILNKFQPPFTFNDSNTLTTTYRKEMKVLMKKHNLKKLPLNFGDELDDKFKEIRKYVAQTEIEKRHEFSKKI